MRIAWPIAVGLLIVVSQAFAADELPEAWRPRVASLNGTWDVLPGHGDAEVFKPEVAAKLGPWGTVDVPGPWAKAKGLGAQERSFFQELPHMWYRRSFDVPIECRYVRTVLRLAAVRWGSKIWINGKSVGEHLGAFGVNDFDVTDFLRPGEKNVIVMRLLGWTQLPRSAKRKQPLVAPGSAPHGWGFKGGGVSEFIQLHHYNEAFIRSTRLQADPKTGRVHARVAFRNYGWNLTRIGLRIEVLKDARVVASAKKDFGKWVSVHAKRADYTLEIETAVKEPKRWWPEDPQLYTVRVTLVQDGEVADVFQERIGFRTFEIKGRAFYLNGRRIFLRGTNLLAEWVWRSKRWFPDEAAIRRYLSAYPRMYYGNCIRTHSLPMSKAWLRIADEVGLIVLQEFPLTINYDTFEFTPVEFDTFAGNVEREYATMIDLYYNHASILMWVPTNESPHWEDWENGPLHELFKQVDPSRPVMRAGRASPDIFDTHSYDGLWNGAVGDFHLVMGELAERARERQMILTNTEYIENCNLSRGYRFLGPKLDKMTAPKQAEALRLLRGEVVREQSEVLRRLGCQLILHYYRHQIDNWDDPARARLNPSGLAMRSAFAPVAVTIDLFDRHFVASRKLPADMIVMNGTRKAVEGELRLVVLPETPPADWDGGRGARVDAYRQTLTVLPFEHKKMSVPCVLPATEGGRVLAAVWRSAGQEPSISIRPIWRLIAPAPAALAGCETAVFEADAALSKWLTGFGARPVDLAAARLAVVGPNIHRSAAFPAQVAMLRRFVEAGGRLVILEQNKWIYDDLVKVETPVAGRRSGLSTVFFKDRPDHPMWKGIPEPMLRRFNGIPGTICRYTLQTAAAHETLAFGSAGSYFPKDKAVIRIPVGKGEILFCNLQLLARTQHGTKLYDPVAERILVNLVKGMTAQ